MKNTIIKKALVAVSLLATAGFVGIASAHDYAGTLSGGVAPTYWGGQTDVWQISCPAGDGAHHLALSIINIAPVKTPIVSFAAYKSGIPTVVLGENDPVDNDITNPNPYSRVANIPGGAGDYYIIVKKTEGKTTATSTAAQRAAAVAAQSYSISAHCDDINGGHVNVNDQAGFLLQNQ
jgi:hypothetical protein